MGESWERDMTTRSCCSAACQRRATCNSISGSLIVRIFYPNLTSSVRPPIKGPIRWVDWRSKKASTNNQPMDYCLLLISIERSKSFSPKSRNKWMRRGVSLYYIKNYAQERKLAVIKKAIGNVATSVAPWLFHVNCLISCNASCPHHIFSLVLLGATRKWWKIYEAPNSHLDLWNLTWGEVCIRAERSFCY